MVDRPILFSAPMILAFLAGRKTQTRRILKLQPGDLDKPFMMGDGSWHVTDSRGGHMSPLDVRYRAGDRLWVREAWRTEARYDHLKPRDVPVGSLISYEADYDQEPNDGCRGRYRHGRFMMRWMSRITDTVTDVRVERLQDIGMDDAAAEGLRYIDDGPGAGFWVVDGTPVCGDGTVEAYQQLWEHINGDGAWARNDWVTALTFTVAHRNIDSAPMPEREERT